MSRLALFRANKVDEQVKIQKVQSEIQRGKTNKLKAQKQSSTKINLSAYEILQSENNMQDIPMEALEEVLKKLPAQRYQTEAVDSDRKVTKKMNINYANLEESKKSHLLNSNQFDDNSHALSNASHKSSERKEKEPEQVSGLTATQRLIIELKKAKALQEQEANKQNQKTQESQDILKDAQEQKKSKCQKCKESLNIWKKIKTSVQENCHKFHRFMNYKPKVPGEFFCHGKLNNLAPKSLGCMTNKNKYRRLMVWITESKTFENFIMIGILANSICLAMYDFSDQEGTSKYNKNLSIAGTVFSVIFTFEAIMKIIAQGFVMSKNTYLRSAWNVLDFLIVLVGIVEITLDLIDIQGVNLKSLRTLRVLRPLKGLKTIPALRKQVHALLMSILSLVNVVIFLFFVFILFGIMGLQWFSETVYYRCRLTPEPVNGVWEISPDHFSVCSPNLNLGGYHCPEDLTCGSPYQYGISPEDDGVIYDASVQFGIGSFSTIFQAILAVFQVITMDSWTTVLYNLAYGSGGIIPSLFCVSLIFLGSFFLINLMLAVIMENYMLSEQQLKELEEQELEEEQQRLQERIERSLKSNIMNWGAMLQNIAQKNRENQVDQQVEKEIKEKEKLDSDDDGDQKQKDNNDEIEFQNKSPSNNTLEKEDKEEKSDLGSDQSQNQQNNHLPVLPEIVEEESSSSKSNKNITNQSVSQSLRDQTDSKKASDRSGLSQSDKAISPGEQSRELQNVISSLQNMDYRDKRQSQIKAYERKKSVMVPSKTQKLDIKPQPRKRQSVSLMEQGVRNMVFQKAKTLHLAQMEKDITDLVHDEIQAKEVAEEMSKKATTQSRMFNKLLSSSIIRNRVLSSAKEVQKASLLRCEKSKSFNTDKLKSQKAKEVVNNVKDQVIAAVQLNRVQDKLNAQKQITLNSNQLMMNLRNAILSKYKKTKKNQYGFKDENNTLEVMRYTIQKQFKGIKKGEVIKGKSFKQKNDPTPETEKPNNEDGDTKKDETNKDEKSETEKAPSATNTLVNALKELKALKAKEEAAKNGGQDLLQIPGKTKDEPINTNPFKISQEPVNKPSAKLSILDACSRAFQKNIDEQSLKEKLGQRMLDIAKEKRAMCKAYKKAQSVIKDDIQNVRANRNILFYFCLKIITSRSFEIFIPFCIIANTLLLSFDKYPNDASNVLIMEQLNFIFYCIFTIEMVLKLLGLGIRTYFSDSANSFDFFVVLVSSIDVGLMFTDIGSNIAQAIQVLRVFRLLRVFKLARVWKSFNYILITIVNALKKISSFSVLLYLFMFTFTVLGMELFAYKVAFDENNEPNTETGSPPASHFNNFLEASISVFIVLANDGWSTIYFDHYRAIGWAVPTFFFIGLVIIGQNIIFQLFLAILLQEFDERSFVKSENSKTKKKDKSFKEQIQRFYRFACNIKKSEKPIKTVVPAQVDQNPVEIDADQNRNLRQQQTVESQNQSIQQGDANPFKVNQLDENTNDNNTIGKKNYSSNRSLYLFSEDNCFRVFLIKLIHSSSDDFDAMLDNPTKMGDSLRDEKLKSRDQWQTTFIASALDLPKKTCMKKVEDSNIFENLIMLLILISSILLAFENPLNDPDGELANFLVQSDTVMTVLFTLEIVIKVIAQGLIINGSNSYLRNSWNILDFLIVTTSIMSLSMPNVDLSVFKIARMFRLLRPLRVISRNERLKISILAMTQSLPQIANLLVIVLLFMFIFGIIGVNLFKGQMYYCLQDQIIGTIDPSFNLVDKYDCFNIGGEWVKFHTNFDSIGESMIQMFTMSQTVGWAAIMYRVMDSNGIEKQPGYHSSPYTSIFFIVYIIIGAFFITNLFVGVMISSYNRESERLGKNFMLTSQQKEWIETKLLLMRISPKLSHRPPKSKCRLWCYKKVNHRYFDYFIMVCISLNTVLLMVTWTGISEETERITDYINYVFMGIFTFEAVFKLFALGKYYFRDNWNTFDFLIVIGSLAFAILAGSTNFDFSSTTQIVRALRIGRIFKLFRSLKSLQVIFATFIQTFPALMNVGGLMFLLIYIYAVLAVNLFAQIKYNGPMHSMLNFQSVPIAYLTLIRMATGENWNDLLDAISQKHSVVNQCITSPTYEDYVAAGEAIGCGKPMTATAFVTTYVLLVSMIFLNLFIAIILDGYFQIQSKEKQQINQSILDQYQDTWAIFDPDATGFIDIDEFSNFMLTLGKPLGWDKSYVKKPEKKLQYLQMISKQMRTANNGKSLMFSDLLDNLTLYYVIMAEIKASMREDDQQFDSDSSEEYVSSSSSSNGEDSDDKSKKDSQKESNSISINPEDLQNAYQDKFNNLRQAEKQKDVSIVKSMRAEQMKGLKKNQKFVDKHKNESENELSIRLANFSELEMSKVQNKHGQIHKQMSHDQVQLKSAQLIKNNEGDEDEKFYKSRHSRTQILDIQRLAQTDSHLSEKEGLFSPMNDQFESFQNNQQRKLNIENMDEASIKLPDIKSPKPNPTVVLDVIQTDEEQIENKTNSPKKSSRSPKKSSRSRKLEKEQYLPLKNVPISSSEKNTARNQVPGGFDQERERIVLSARKDDSENSFKLLSMDSQRKNTNNPIKQIINFHEVQQMPLSSINFSPKAPENRYQDNEIAVSLDDGQSNSDVIEIHKKRVINSPSSPNSFD